MRTKIVVLCAGLVLGLFPNLASGKSKPPCPEEHLGTIEYTVESFVFDMPFDMRCFGKGATLTYEGSLTRRDPLGMQEDRDSDTCKKKNCSIHFEIAHGPIEHADYDLWFNVQITSRSMILGGSGVGQWTCTSAAAQVFCQ